MLPSARLRFVAYGICALLTAACGDALVEALQNAGTFGVGPIDANHQGVLPVLGLAALAVAALGAAIVRDRCFSTPTNDWLRVLARDLDRTSFRTHVSAIVVGALGLVTLIEEYERGFGGAAPFDGARATPLQTFGSLAVYVTCATFVAYALAAFVRGLAATCDALMRVVAIVVALLVRVQVPAIVFACETRRDVPPHPGTVLCGLFGDRAPPGAA